MPVSTRRTAPPRSSTNQAAYGEHDHHASSSDSSDSDDEGIPAETPKRSKLQAMATLAMRQSPMKRRLEVEAGQLTRSPKKLKSSGLLKATAEKLRPRSLNDYPTPNSSRIAPEPAEDAVSLLDANSVHTSEEEEDDGYVNPNLLAAVNRSCGNRKPKESPSRQLQEEIDNIADGDDDISVIALDEQEEADPGQINQYADSEDFDLGVEPTNQGTMNHGIVTSHIDGAIAVGLSDVQKPNQVSSLAEAVAESGSEHGIEKDQKSTQSSRIDAPQTDIYEIPESPEPVTSMYTSMNPKIQVSSMLKRRVNALKQTKRKSPTISEVISQEQSETAIENNARMPDLEIMKLTTEIRGADGSSTLTRLRPVQQSEESFTAKDAFDGTHASSNSGSTLGADEAEPDTPQGGDDRGDDDEYLEDAENNGEPGSVSDEDDADGLMEITAQFSRDILHFENKIQQADDNLALFNVAIDNPLLSIHLPPQCLSKANQLMKRLGWTAITKQWQENLTDKRQPRTSPGKHLVRYLLRLERFFLMVPSYPDLSAQKDFLTTHKDMLRFYFSAIEVDVKHIQSHRLSSRSNTAAEKQDPARSRMAEDLVRLVIPLMIRVLGEAWTLGGDEADSAFTGLTVQILARLVGWLKKLYEPLSSEPQICFPKGGSSITNAKSREALGPLLKTMQILLKETPDRFREKEESRLRSESNRQIKLRRQEEIRTRRQVEAKLREIAYIEQNSRVAQAIRGVRPSPRQTPDLAQWRTEEELSLCNRLKTAYDYNPPRLPQLATIALVLGHSEQEVKNKSRDLLKVMLAQAYPEKTGRDIQDMANEVMQQWS